VKGISIRFRERDSPNFESHRLNGSHSLNFLRSLFQRGKTAKDAVLSFKASLKAYDLLRRVLFEDLARGGNLLKGELEADESYFGGSTKRKERPGCRSQDHCFGILERDGKVSVSIVIDVKAESLMNETVKKVRRGSIVYTNKWRGCDSPMFCGYHHLSIDHKYKFKKGKGYIKGIEGFWVFAKERLMKHHGISKEKFLYYIKEMKWRTTTGRKIYLKFFWI